MDKSILPLLHHELQTEYPNRPWGQSRTPGIVVVLTLIIIAGLALGAEWGGILVMTGCFLAGVVGWVVIERFWKI